ncbi:MAG: Calx-beta domain-containing protein, partial [Planctomycetota bacterium]
AEVGGSVTSVKFYRDTNGTTGLQVGSDTLVGSGTQSGSTWTFATTTGSLASGSYTYYAVASDASNASSTTVSAVLTVTNPLKPVIGSFTVSPASVTAGGSITLTASNVTETGGSVSGVTFYRETSGSAGLQVGSDVVVGSGTRSGTTWTLATTTVGLAPGFYTYYAVATDPANASSLVASAVLAVTSPSTSATPSLSISSASILEGNSGTRTLAFLVSLTAPAAVTTTVGFRTSDITATAGSDYQRVTNGTLTFRIGQRTATIVIQVFSDTVIEPDETFQVELFNPVNATLGISTAVGTILNDDVGTATPATQKRSPTRPTLLAPARP